MEDYLRIGRVISTHGLDGSLKVYVISDIEGRFYEGREIFFNLNGFYKKYTIEHCQVMKERQIKLSLCGLDDVDSAGKLAGSDVYVDKNSAVQEYEKGEDEFFYHELFDAEVYWKGELLGVVSDVLDAGGGDILVIARKGKPDVMIPFVDSMVDLSCIKEGKIDVTPVEGLIED